MPANHGRATDERSGRPRPGEPSRRFDVRRYAEVQGCEPGDRRGDLIGRHLNECPPRRLPISRRLYLAPCLAPLVLFCSPYARRVLAARRTPRFEEAFAHTSLTGPGNRRKRVWVAHDGIDHRQRQFAHCVERDCPRLTCASNGEVTLASAPVSFLQPNFCQPRGVICDCVRPVVGPQGRSRSRRAARTRSRPRSHRRSPNSRRLCKTAGRGSKHQARLRAGRSIARAERTRPGRPGGG
jgi:hypothetical protein